MNSLQRAIQTLSSPGLFSFPLTPFDPDDGLDLVALREHVEAQIAAGPAALFVACGTGEFTALGLDEYEKVVTAAVAQAASRLPVFAGVGAGPALLGTSREQRSGAMPTVSCCFRLTSWHRRPGASSEAGIRLAGPTMGPVRPPLVDAKPEHVEQLGMLLERGRTVLGRWAEARA